ncbi:MAG: GMC family oxidoreductase [Gammaproteobacteria bacterium]|nr:GMC family oxidoreductase [Gammaproteobacteria bacterium]
MSDSNARADVVIVGSGAGGVAAALPLVESGRRVVMLERGQPLPRDGSTLDVGRVVERGEFLAHEPWRDGDGRVFEPEEHFNVGGKTKWYGAALFRFDPAEFGADPGHGCPAWPISHEELAPFYAKAEALLGVHSFAVEPDLDWILARLRRVAARWHAAPMPMGLSAEIIRYPDEASHFDGFASARGLKGEAESRGLCRLSDRANFDLVTGVEVATFLGAPADPHRVIGVEATDGRRWQADRVVLAAGALHSPRLLARYLDRSGLAASLPAADAVGRYLKLHALSAMVSFSWRPMRDVLRKTMVLTHPEFPHSTAQPLGFDADLIARLIPRAVPRAVARCLARRAYGFFLQTEDGSSPENRVMERAVAGGVERVMDYRLERSSAAAREHRRFVRAMRRAFLSAGMPTVTRRIAISGTAHACGTLAAGSDPRRSVVGADGRVHGLRGLYVADGSVLSRISRVNPALTIFAWGLRLGTLLAGHDGDGVGRAADANHEE